jgi:hypothetical protein
MGIGPTLFGYLVQCEIVQSEMTVAMELFVASVQTSGKNQDVAILDLSKI